MDRRPEASWARRAAAVLFGTHRVNDEHSERALEAPQRVRIQYVNGSPDELLTDWVYRGINEAGVHDFLYLITGEHMDALMTNGAAVAIGVLPARTQVTLAMKVESRKA